MRHARTVFLLCLLTACALAADSAIAIRNARIVTVSGATIEKGTVVVRNGLIESVGPGATPPAGAWVIEGEGLTVYPGLIDALSTWGIPEAAPTATAAVVSSRGRVSATPAAPSPQAPSTPTEQQQPARGPEDRPSTTSWTKAADLVQPTDRRLESVRAAGFTTAVTFPTRGIIAGQGAVVNLAGERGGRMVVAAPAGMYLSFSGGGFSSYPGSLMGVIAYVRQVYLDAGHYRMVKERYAKNAVGLERPAYDRALEGVLEAPRVLLPGTRAVEIDRSLRLARDLNSPAIIYGGHEAYKVTGQLKAAKTPVLVNLRWPERERESDPEQTESLRILEMREQAPSAPGRLLKAGVPFALYSGGIERPRDILRAVKRAIDAGLPEEAAVRALTQAPAEIYGVADRLGSIEKGKIANLVVVRGGLFQDRPEIRCVLIDGVKYEPAPEPDVTEALR